MIKKSPTAEKSRRVDPRQASNSARTVRETVESIVIAFILAFLFRTFEAEAFVIPTGSMAPTLQGMHKDVVCPKCGYRYRVGASTEGEEEDPSGRVSKAVPVVAGICPMCRFPDKSLADQPTYKGDYILVGKFPFEFFPEHFGEPRRWDVVVFCYPGNAKINYIKRLVGLPNEIVRIRDGDIYISHDVGRTYAIERKPPEKIRAMLQPVYDNDVNMSYLRERGWPDRWQVWGGEAQAQGWKADADVHAFHTDGAGESWIRYQHTVPAPWDWDRLVQGQLPANYQVRPELITDFYAYDTNVTAQNPLSAAQFGLHWVGDLALECEAKVEGHDGELMLDLVKGGRHFSCRIDASTGEAKFAIAGLAENQYGPTAKTPITGPGTYRLMFANVDQELLLWVNGKLVVDPTQTAYDALGNNRPISTTAEPGDLAPAGIGSRGLAVTVNHIKLGRDVYYIATKETRGPITEIPPWAINAAASTDSWIKTLSDPRAWHSDNPKLPGPFDRNEGSAVDFPLETDQFFMLGDNSPYSQDSRLWGSLGIPGLKHFVDRKLLIGKAMFIYWPHSFNRIPGLNMPFPFFPNFPDMGFVR